MSLQWEGVIVADELDDLLQRLDTKELHLFAHLLGMEEEQITKGSLEELRSDCALEFRRFGGSSLKNVGRRLKFFQEAPYKEIVRDAAKAMGVNVKGNLSLKLLEQRILAYAQSQGWLGIDPLAQDELLDEVLKNLSTRLGKDSIESLNREALKDTLSHHMTMIKNGRLPMTVAVAFAPDSIALTPELLKHLLGSEVYKQMALQFDLVGLNQVFNNAIQEGIGRVLGDRISETVIGKSILAFVGVHGLPIAFSAILGTFLLYKLDGPAFRRTIPAVVFSAAYRSSF